MQMRMRTMSLSINWKHCPSQNSNRISSGISTCLTGGSVDDNASSHVDDNSSGGFRGSSEKSKLNTGREPKLKQSNDRNKYLI